MSLPNSPTFVRSSKKSGTPRPGILISSSRSLTQPNLLDYNKVEVPSATTTTAPLPTTSKQSDLLSHVSAPTTGLLHGKSANAEATALKKKGSSIQKPSSGSKKDKSTLTTTPASTKPKPQQQPQSIPIPDTTSTSANKPIPQPTPIAEPTPAPTQLPTLTQTITASPTHSAPTTPRTPDSTPSTPRTPDSTPSTPRALESTPSTTPRILGSSTPSTPRALESTPSTTPRVLGRSPSTTSAETITRLSPDEEKEKLKTEKEHFRGEVISIVREIKIQHLTAGTAVRMFTKNKVVGVQGYCRLSEDRKYLQFYEKPARSDDEFSFGYPTEQIVVNSMSSVDPSLSPTLEPQLVSALSKKEFDQSLMLSLLPKDQNTPAVVFLFGSRNDVASWHDGFSCLMGAAINSSVLKADVELLCEVLALDKLYPTPPLPPLPPPELLAALE